MIPKKNMVDVGKPAPMNFVMATSKSYLTAKTNSPIPVNNQSQEYSSLSFLLRTNSMIVINIAMLIKTENTACLIGIYLLLFFDGFSRNNVTKMDKSILKI